MQGQINDMQNSLAQLTDLLLRDSSPRQCNSGVSAKRARVDENDRVEYIQPIPELEPEAPTPTPAMLFNSQFKKPTNGYPSRTLAGKLVEEFVYDWYAKSLGSIQGPIASINTARWDITIGVKVCNDNVLDAKNIILLTEKIASESELKAFRAEQPNAATDSTYTGWEMNIKAAAKSVVKVLGEFLIMKEGKTGNAKSYTIGALARRWKNLKYPVPTTDELEASRNAALRAGGKKSIGSTGGRSDNGSSSSSSSSSSSVTCMTDV